MFYYQDFSTHYSSRVVNWRCTMSARSQNRFDFVFIDLFRKPQYTLSLDIDSLYFSMRDFQELFSSAAMLLKPVIPAFCNLLCWRHLDHNDTQGVARCYQVEIQYINSQRPKQQRARPTVMTMWNNLDGLFVPILTWSYKLNQ
jgi:hypothetical protein